MAGRSRRFLTPEEIADASPEAIIEAFLPLARAMAARARPGCEDTEQDARVGLVKAGHHYDASLGPFAAYAALYIQQAISRGSSGQRHVIWLPPAVRSRLSRVLASRDRLGDNSTAADIASDLGGDWTAEQVQALLEVPRTIPGDEVSDDSQTAIEQIYVDPTTEGEFSFAAMRIDLEAITDDLPADLAVEVQKWLDTPDSEGHMRRVAEAVRAHVAGETLL